MHIGSQTCWNKVNTEPDAESDAVSRGRAYDACIEVPDDMLVRRSLQTAIKV